MTRTSALSPGCILILPESESGEGKRLRGLCRQRAAEVGYRLKVLRSESIRIVGAPGRRMNVLSPADASTVYRDLHRAPALVLAFASIHVRVDPSRRPPDLRSTKTLREFVAYKSTFGLVRGNNDVGHCFDEFARWRTEVHCDGSGDPRVLPLHVFDLDGGSFDLARKDEVDRFDRKFGLSDFREDGRGRIWNVGVPHGREALRVSGKELPAGAHWDVSIKGRSCRIANSREVWKVEGNGYVNVYPDEHVRRPSAKCKGRVRRVWNDAA